VKSSASSLLFGTVALLGVGAKLASNVATPEPSLDPFRAAGARLLGAQGWSVWKDPAGPLRGRRGGCRVLLGDYSPYGTFADVYAEMARPIGPLRFAYRGARYERAPKLRPLVEFYLGREVRRLGYRVPRHPIAAFAVTRGCALDERGWQGLSTLAG
jgi:hypothetical protein